MKNSLTCLLLLCSPLLGSAKADLADFVSSDAVVYIQLDDWNDFSEKLDSGPMGVFSESPIWGKMVKWVEGELEDDLDSGTMEEMKELMIEWKDSFNGGMIMSVGNIEKMLSAGDEDSSFPPNLTILVQTDSAQKDLTASLRWMKKEVMNTGGKFSWERSKVAGNQVHWIGAKASDGRKEEIALVLRKGILFFLLGGEEHVQETLLLAGGESGTKNISGDSDFQDVFDEIGKGDARLYLNFKPLVHMLEDLSENPETQIPENPFGVKTAGVIEALGLGSLESMGLQVDLDREHFSISSAFFLSKYEGLFSLLESKGKKAKLHDFIPQNLFSATTARYDLSQLWPRMEAIIGKISPQLLLLVNSQIQGFEDQIGVPFRKNVLGSLGDEIVTISQLNPNWTDNLGQFFSEGRKDELKELTESSPTNEVYAISLSDPKLFDQALRATVDGATKGADLFEERKHKGVLIRSMRGLEQTGISISYAVTDKWLLLSMGGAPLLNQVINRMESADDSIWERKDVKRALKNFPDGVSQVDYFDFGQIMEMFKPMIDEMMEGQEIKLKSSDIPEFPFFMLAWSKSVKNGVIGKAELFPKTEARGD
jgi:hypothetical protein